jgi:hypothetical protein
MMHNFLPVEGFVAEVPPNEKDMFQISTGIFSFDFYLVSLIEK